MSTVGLIVQAVFVGLAITVAVGAGAVFRSRPIGVWGDLAVATAANVAFALGLGHGWTRMLLTLGDAYPAWLALAYMPIVAFVATGFVRSLVPLLPARNARPSPEMAMAQADGSGVAAPGNVTSAAQIVPEPSPKPASGWTRRLNRVLGIAVLLVVSLIAVARFVARNDLPDCDSGTARDLLSNIFQQNDIKVKRYDEIRAVTRSDSLNSCTAFMTMMDNHAAEIDYQIAFLVDRQVQVRITAGRDKALTEKDPQ